MEEKMNGPVKLKARWVVGNVNGCHVLYENGEVVFDGNQILFAGHDYPGESARQIDYGNALISTRLHRSRCSF